MKIIRTLALYSLLLALPLGCAVSTEGGTPAADTSGLIVTSERLVFRDVSDEKLRSFTADAGTLYRISTAADDTAPGADTMLILYDSSMTELARNDDKGPGLPGTSLEELKKNPLKLARTLLTMHPDDLDEDCFSEITWKAPATGTYHVRVVPHDGSPESLGSFTLSVSEIR